MKTREVQEICPQFMAGVHSLTDILEERMISVMEKQIPPKDLWEQTDRDALAVLREIVSRWLASMHYLDAEGKTQ